jgi:hypothetical protein
VNDWVVR